MKVINFLSEPNTMDFQFNPNQTRRKFSSIEKDIQNLLREYSSSTNKIGLIASMRNLIDNISADEASFFDVLYNDPLKIKIAVLVGKYLTLLANNNQYSSSSIELLLLYVELIAEHGLHSHLESGQQLIAQLTNNPLFATNHQRLSVFTKILHIADLMIHFQIPRYELRGLLRTQEGNAFEVQLNNIAFRLIVVTKEKWIRAEIARRRRVTPIARDNPALYSDQFWQLIGRLYLSEVGSVDRKLWDIFNHEVIFFDLVLFERECSGEVESLLQYFKNSDFKTQQAICQQLRKQKLISPLIQSLQALANIPAGIDKEILPYSEIYFTESEDTQWANSCQGVGYLIIRYGASWVSLYNTSIGHMTNITGIIFDAQLLDSTTESLYFKVLKRDGWHFFSSLNGLDVEAWEDIRLLHPIDPRTKNTGYMLCRRDKVSYLVETQGYRRFKKFKNIRDIVFVTHNNEGVFFLIKKKTYWFLVNLSKMRLIESLPSHVVNVQIVGDTNKYLVLTTSNEDFFLYAVRNGARFLLEDFKQVHFSSFSEVYCEANNGTFFVVQNCQKQTPITNSYFNKLSRYHLNPPESFMRLHSRGIAITSDGAAVRYDFTMELQGRYHITESESSSLLRLSNTVHMDQPRTLKTAKNIGFLGVSRIDRKVFFLVEEGGRAFLYISPYSLLKRLFDADPNFVLPIEELIDLPNNTIRFLHDNYLQLFDNGEWLIYEYCYGYHARIKAQEFKILDGRNFLKVKINDLWYLYDLSIRHLVSAEGAKSIELTAENKIVIIYKNHIRYLRYDDLPHYAQASAIAGLTNQVTVANCRDNYHGNLLRLAECKGIVEQDYNQPFVLVLLSHADHPLLASLSSRFVRKTAELLDGKVIDMSGIRQKLTQLITDIKAYIAQTNSDLKEIKMKIRSLVAELSTLKEYVKASFALRPEIISNLLMDQLPQLQLQTQQNQNIGKDVSKLIAAIEIFNQLVQEKLVVREQFMALMATHRHVLSGILKYWASIDSQGDNIDDLYCALEALMDLYNRGRNFTEDDDESANSANITTIIRKHYLNLIKLYRFNAQLINNYVIAEMDDLNAIQDLFALLDLLPSNKRELKFITDILELGPSLHSLYETLKDRAAEETEYSRIKKCMHALRLMAIARELGSDELYQLDCNHFKQTYQNPEQRQDIFIKAMAKAIQKTFIAKLNITLNDGVNFNIPEEYFTDIIYASEHLKGEDKIFLIIMLKAIAYNLDIRLLFSVSLSDAQAGFFSNVEQGVLRRIQEHNSKVKTAFQSQSIHWDKWQVGIPAISGRNFTVSLWQRKVSHDLFQGEFCNSCISLAKGNARANLYYLMDFNFSMIEIKENVKGTTIGHVTLWVGIANRKPTLVLNSIQVHRKYVHHSQEIRNLIFEYSERFSAELDLEEIILASGYNTIPMHVLYHIDDAGKKPVNAKWLRVSHESDDGNAKPVVFKEIQIEIIYPTFTTELYSDVYFDGWKTVAEMGNESANVWDLLLFLSQATYVACDDLRLEQAQFNLLKNYEIWLIGNNQLQGIQLNREPKLIFINRSLWGGHRINILKLICEAIQRSNNDEQELIPLNTITSAIAQFGAIAHINSQNIPQTEQSSATSSQTSLLPAAPAFAPGSNQ